MNLQFTRATTDDVPTLEALFAEAVEWLASKNSDQWQPDSMRTVHKKGASDRSLAHSIQRGEVFLVLEDGKPVGSLSIDGYADPEFWTPSDHPDDALYLHRMIVSRSAAGRDLGSRILEWAAQRAVQQGKAWIRLDAWRGNSDLAAYYYRHGFHHVRTVELSQRRSGVLFQRSANPL